MPLTNYACPACDKAGLTSQMMATQNSMQCTVNPGHVWNDSLQFQELRPRMAFTIAPPPVQPQAAHTKMTLNVSIPMAYDPIIRSKLGPRLESTIAGILSMMAEGEVLLIGHDDIQKLKRLPIIGKIPANGNELLGMIYAADLQRTDDKAEAVRAQKELMAWEGRNPHMVMVDLGEQYEYARRKAEDENMPVKLWLERQIISAMENNWF